MPGEPIYTCPVAAKGFPSVAHATSSAHESEISEPGVSVDPGNAIRLFQHALASFTALPGTALLHAFGQLGVRPDVLAEVLGVDHRVVMAWRGGRREIPEEQRTLLVAYLSVILPWLYAAQGHVAVKQAALQPFWRQRYEMARHVLETETNVAPARARRAQALADQMDAVNRQEAVRVVTEFWQQAGRPPARKAARKVAPPAEHVARRAG